MTNHRRPLDRDWVDRAACAGYPPGWFDLPDAGVSPRQALTNQANAASRCVVCPVRDECLTEAVTDRSLVGVWGGRLFPVTSHGRSRPRFNVDLIARFDATDTAIERAERKREKSRRRHAAPRHAEGAA